MANKNRFTILDTPWSVVADGAYISGGSDASLNRESYQDLQDLINGAEGGTLDLTGRAFAPTASEIASADDHTSFPTISHSGDELTITGGTFYGGATLSWSAADEDGIRSASLAPNINNNAGDGYYQFQGVSKLHDEEANDVPFMAVYPPPAEATKYAAATWFSTWIDVRSSASDGSANIVYTEQGDNATGNSAKITGFQINDPAVRLQIDEAFTHGIADLTLMMRAGANIVEYFKVTSFDPVNYDISIEPELDGGPQLHFPSGQYCNIAFTGDPTWITEEGHFCMRRSNETVYYKPPAESSGEYAITGGLNMMFYLDGANKLNFTGSAFLASGGKYENGGFVDTQNGAAESQFTNCRFQTGITGIRGRFCAVLADGCTFDNLRARGINSQEGTIIDGCRFTRIEKSSGALIQCADQPAEDPNTRTPVTQTQVRNSYFNMLEANHGQGISLYKGAWQNAIVEHNIFICQRAHSLQRYALATYTDNGTTKRYVRSATGTYTFRNNLVIHDFDVDSSRPNGQAVYAFNGSGYPETEADNGDKAVEENDQTVYIYNNVVLSALNNRTSDYSMFLPWLEVEQKYIANNIVGRLRIASVGNPANTAYNILTTQEPDNDLNTQPNSTDVEIGTTPGWGGVQSDYYDFDSLTPKGLALTHASDGKRVGIRWDNGIDLDTAKDPPPDWYTQYPALELPDPTTNTVPFFDIP